MLSKSLTIGAAGNSLPPGPDPVWNLSTATFNGTPTNFNALGQTDKQLFWSGTGTTLFRLTGATLLQYTASSAFDISTISFVQSTSITTLTGDAGTRSMFVRADGLKLYVTGDGTGSVIELTFSSANDISTLSLTRSFSFAGQTATANGVFFKPDGTKMYVIGTATGTRQIFEYTLSTAWNVSTASYTHAFNNNIVQMTSLAFSSNGSYAYTVSGSTDLFYQYTLGTAWNISTAVLTTTLSTAPYGLNAQNICFNDTGSKMYVSSSTQFATYSLDLGTPWALSTASYTPPSNSVKVTQDGFALKGMYIDPTGNHLYRITNAASDTVYQYVFGTPFDLTTLSYVRSLSVAGQEANPLGITFKPDGTKMYVVGWSGDDVNEYTLGTAWNISTASFVQSKSVSAQFTFPFDVVFKPDGKKMYVAGWVADNIAEYSLSSAWNVSTASYVRSSNITFRPEWETLFKTALYFRSDGFYLYITGGTSSGTGLVYEYVLSTAWDISTLSLVQTKSVIGSSVPLISGGTQLPQLAGLSFNPDGSQIFLADEVSLSMVSFDMTPPTP